MAYGCPITHDAEIEQQLTELISPDGDMVGGTLPEFVEYRTKVCESIRITLYDENRETSEDITDKALFYSNPDIGYDYDDGFIPYRCFLITSDKKVLGGIPDGSTIEEYLAYKPMIFAGAGFTFPDIDKDAYDNGIVHVEIELEDGVVLIAEI